MQVSRGDTMFPTTVSTEGSMELGQNLIVFREIADF
jgi:hypothetical protein